MVWSTILHADAAQDVAEPAPAPARSSTFDIQPPWSLSDIAALFRFVTLVYIPRDFASDTFFTDVCEDERDRETLRQIVKNL